MLKRLGIALPLVVILVSTLHPEWGHWSRLRIWCMLCGERDAADALMNLALFVPLGLGLAAAGDIPVPRVVMLGLGLAILIEFCQLIIPGRDPSARDVLFNGLGTAIGAALFQARRWWVNPVPRIASRLALGAAATMIAVMAAAGFLLQPSFTRNPYAALWTQEQRRGESYRGRIVEAHAGSIEMPSAHLAFSDSIRALIQAGAELRVRAVAGPPVSRFAPIFAIVDGDSHEQLTLAADANDLILRFRTRSADIRLDRPDVRLRGAMTTLEPGKTMDIRAAWRRGRGWCLSLNQTQQCDLGFTVAEGWRVIYPAFTTPKWLSNATGFFWLVGLTLPVGFWLRTFWPSLLAAASLAIALSAIPRATGLLPTGFLEWCAVASGIVLGRTASRVSTTLNALNGSPSAAARTSN